MPVRDRSDMDNMAIGTVANTTPFFGDAGGTNPAQATIQQARSGSHPLGLLHNYLEYKRTTAATGFVIHTPFTGSALYRLRFYMSIVTAWSGNSAIVYLTSAGTNRCQIFMTSTRTLQLRNVAAAVGVASSALVLGTRYRCEWLVDMPNSQQQLVVYSPDETTVFYDSGLVAVTNAAFTQLRLGNTVSSTGENHYACFAEADNNVEIGEVGPEHGFPIAA